MWQSTYSQLLYQDDKKGEPLPPYDPNVAIISPDIEKWMNEQVTNKDGNKRIVKMKTDVLGRVKSRSFNRSAEEKVIENKQKRLVRISDMHIPQIEIEPIQGRYEYNLETKDYNYYLNSKKVSLKEYENFMEKYWEKFDSQKKDKRNLPIPGIVSSNTRSWIALMTAEEILKLTNNYKEFVIEDYIEPVDEAGVTPILSRIQLSTHAFPNGYEGYAVGVGVVELSCRDTSIPLYRPYRYTNYCSGTTSSHHSGVVNIVQHASPLAQVFGFRQSTNEYPDPNSYSPPLQVATYSYGTATGLSYSGLDMEMDNYIYNKRIIGFKSAGNDRNTHYITSPGKAVNIITVGAVCPAVPCWDTKTLPDNYTSYSSWKNSEVGNEKPEQAMFTDIDMGIYGSLDGTSAAAPLLAGFTATVLDQHPFFKRHPALMKAVLLTGETIPIQNASSWDTDNYYGAARAITTYSSVAWGTGSLYCEGGNSSCFNSNNQLIVDENVQANKRYRIAIAWLVPGNYVSSNKKLPQDIDLIVYQNGKIIAQSMSVRNPYEIVDFVPTSNAPLKVVIHRYSNSGHGNVLLGYHRRGGF